MKFKTIILISLGVVLAMSPLTVNAQLSKLDIGQLIEGLRQEGLRDLLKHLVDTEPMDDPVLQQQIKANMFLLEYQEYRDGGDIEAAIDSFHQALDAQRQLIQDHYKHEQRPLWQTQLGEMLLFEYLQAMKTNAAQFYTLGIPTKAQSKAYSESVTEALAQLEDANIRFFQLETALPKEADHIEKRVNTGLWARMMKEYYGVRTRYSLAHAMYYTALLPDSDPYYQTLGHNPKILRQKKTIKLERKRLGTQAILALAPLIKDESDAWSIRTRCLTLQGKLLALTNKDALAIKTFDQVIKANQGDLNQLSAELAKAYTLNKQNKSHQALSLIESLKTHTIVKSNLLFQLLVTDAKHRVLLSVAKKLPPAKRHMAVTKAYQPYLDLLNDPALGENAQALRNYVHARWVENISDTTNLKNVPSVLVAAIGETLRIKGQNLSIEAQSLTGAAQQQKTKEAANKLRAAINVNTQLQKRSDCTPNVKANAMFNQGMAMYFVNTADFNQTAKAAAVLTEVANQYPNSTNAETAIDYAAEMLTQLHRSQANVANLTAHYEHCIKVLLKNFPNNETANNERFHFVTTVLIPSKQYTDAIEILNKVPAGHPEYFVSQREKLYCQVALLKEKKIEIKTIQQDALLVIQEANAQNSSDPEIAATIRSAAGHAKLILADLSEQQGNFNQAITYLQSFETEFVQDAEVLRLGLGKRIVLLSKANKLDEAASEASRMMQSFPQDAAAVIDHVLIQLDKQATVLRQQAAEELVSRKKKAKIAQATKISTTASTLAQLLMDWASTQKYSEDELVPFRLILIKSLRTSGQSAKALSLLQSLNKQYPDDADVMLEMAEALFAQGGKQNWLQSAALFKQLIVGLPPTEDGKYPRAYWNAWMRYFQICEKTSQNTNVIMLRVRSLQNSDPNLGGDPFKSELIRLMTKYMY